MPSRPVVMVTGASRGLGRAMTEKLVAAGMDVVGTCVQAQEAAAEVSAAALERGGRVEFMEVDLTDADALLGVHGRVEAILRDSFETDALRALVNNAGGGVLAPYEQTDLGQFDWLMSLNVRAPFFLTQGLLPLLGEGASVINLSTALTRGVVPGGSAYAASKGAIEVLTRYQAVELASRGIRVNTLMGGAARTDFGDGAMYLPAVQQASAEKITLGHMAEPEDIAAVIAALISDDFHWVTGAVLDASGGQSLS